MKYKDFYTELGKLLFAIAKADGRVGVKEFDAMKRIVKEELVALEDSTDEFGTDNAYYTEMEFGYLQENFGDPENAFSSFLDFVDAHRSAFSPALKELVSKISTRIASTEYGINPQEKKYLDRLAEKIDSEGYLMKGRGI